jgi:hypothetical protein
MHDRINNDRAKRNRGEDMSKKYKPQPSRLLLIDRKIG